MPSAGTTVSYSTIAVIPERGISGRVTNAYVGLYTCPDGKKAKVTGTLNLDAVGADLRYAIAIARVVGAGVVFTPVGEHATENNISIIQAKVALQEGDSLTNIGDSGSTNGTCDMDCSVQEITV